MNELIKKIVETEWDMFTKVNNQGGKASCQNDPTTFTIMRISQFAAWDKETLESYLEDLLQAKKHKGNLITEKYARMMAYTVPLEYDAIKHRLPAVSDEKQREIDEIVAIQLEWTQAIRKEFPQLASLGRFLTSNEDDIFHTSVETYLRGELLTYSDLTISLYLKMVKKFKDVHLNLNKEILKNTVKQYGFTSLEKAESFYKNKAEG